MNNEENKTEFEKVEIPVTHEEAESFDEEEDDEFIELEYYDDEE